MIFVTGNIFSIMNKQAAGLKVLSVVLWLVFFSKALDMCGSPNSFDQNVFHLSTFASIFVVSTVLTDNYKKRGFFVLSKVSFVFLVVGVIKLLLYI